MMERDAQRTTSQKRSSITLGSHFTRQDSRMRRPERLRRDDEFAAC